jgi:hypothetical protein
VDTHVIKLISDPQNDSRPTQAGKVKGKRTAKELGAIDSLESTSEAATAVGLVMAASASIELKVVFPWSFFS